MTLNFIDSVGGLRGLCFQDLCYMQHHSWPVMLYQKMSAWYTWTNLNVCQMLIHSTSPCPYTEQLNKYLRWPRCRWVLETHLTSDIKFVWHLMHLTLFSILFDVSTITGIWKSWMPSNIKYNCLTFLRSSVVQDLHL